MNTFKSFDSVLGDVFGMLFDGALSFLLLALFFGLITTHLVLVANKRV